MISGYLNPNTEKYRIELIERTAHQVLVTFVMRDAQFLNSTSNQKKEKNMNNEKC